MNEVNVNSILQGQTAVLDVAGDCMSAMLDWRECPAVFRIKGGILYSKGDINCLLCFNCNLLEWCRC